MQYLHRAIDGAAISSIAIRTLPICSHWNSVVNRDLWDERSVQKAYDRYRRDKKEERVAERVRKAEEQEEELELEATEEEVLIA